MPSLGAFDRKRNGPAISVGVRGAFLTAAGILAALGGSPEPVRAEIVIQDDFSLSGDIRGAQPPTTFEGAAWESGTAPRTVASDGSAALLDTNLGQMAVLPLGRDFFIRNPGVYALSLDVLFPDGSSGQGWVALGFTNGVVTTRSFNDPSGPHGGSPWVLLRANGAAQVFAGVGTGGPLALAPVEFSAGTSHNLKMVLDATGERWGLSVFIDDLPIKIGRHGEESYEFIKSPEISYVGFSANPAEDGIESPVATVDNFRFERLSGPAASP